MRPSLKRTIYSSLTFGSVMFQTLYAYFMFIADEEALDDLTDGYAQTAIIGICITLAILDILESS